MMNPDDEPHLDDVMFNDKSHTNKINDAFGLTKDIPKPINFQNFSKTPPPSTIMQNPLLTNFKPDTINFFNISAAAAPAPVPIQPTDTSRAKSEPKDLQNTANTKPNLITPPKITPFVPLTTAVPVNYNLPNTLVTTPSKEKVQILQPPTSSVLNKSVTPTPTQQNQESLTLMTPAQFTSVLPPPITATPPMPPPSQKSNSTANPYSARGALNKKIYEPVIQSVPVTAQMAPIPPIETTVTTNIYVPPPMSTSTNSLEQSAANVPENVTSTLPPSSPQQYFQPTIQQQEIQRSDMVTPSAQSAFVMSTFQEDSHSNYQQQQQQQQARPPSRNVWNRFVSSLKTGVESVLTTMDPQMKEYMHSVNEHLNILNTSGDKAITELIRNSFNLLGFLRLTIIEHDSRPQTQHAPQLVGYPCALHAINEKLLNSEQYIQQKCILISVQPFIAELSQDCWFDQMCIMLKDTQHNIEVTVYTEAIPIPNEHIYQLKQSTPDDYPLKWSGFATSLNGSSYIEWYESLYGVQQKTLLANALKTLVAVFKNKFINSVPNN